ncbi:MAG TPA: extracellular solute-binding protein, partial [Lachnospiraceae bacterium]|nr:extracellular solute-binding protein [Lachnospiraceae bacterium]
MKKKVISMVLAVTMVASLLAGCGSAATETEEAAPAAQEETEQTEEAAPAEEASAEDTEAADAEGGKVYYLNFKPEQAEQWVALGETYEEQTGVPVTIETAASGTYESTLKSEMAKTEAPTLFQVNGPVGLANWQDYTYDLQDSDVYAQLKSDDFALKGDNGEVYGIAYVIETYGIIYNKKLIA